MQKAMAIVGGAKAVTTIDGVGGLGGAGEANF